MSSAITAAGARGVGGIWALTRVLAADAQASGAFISRAVRALRKAASTAASPTLFLIAVCQVLVLRAGGHPTLHPLGASAPSWRVPLAC